MEAKIKIIVDYWSVFLKGGNLDDAGLGSKADTVSSLRGLLRNDQPTDEQIESFRSTLELVIYTEVNSGCDRIMLSFDYNPCAMLKTALVASGIKESWLPFKTWSCWDLKSGEIKASNGYGAKVVDLMQTPA